MWRRPDDSITAGVSADKACRNAPWPKLLISKRHRESVGLRRGGPCRSLLLVGWSRLQLEVCEEDVPITGLLPICADGGMAD
jgi:hypothetical protein